MNTPKTILVLFQISCLCLAMSLKNNEVVVKADSSTIKVPDDYPTIQEAVNNAGSGDIIFVRKGIYTENIVINKSLTLIGENREGTIIDGGARGNVISVKASNVTISGFTVRNSDPSAGCGILIELFGNIVISNNNIRNNKIGIWISSSNRNQICGNIISANYIGIQLFSSSGNTIYRNVIFGNAVGINAYYYSVGNIFYENVFNTNNWGVLLFSDSNNNVFYHNNFIDNFYNVYTEQTANIWCYNGEGNYWDDYKGEDLDKNGIGDTPYIIAEKNMDYYPLMGRYYTFDVHFKEEDYRISIVSNSTISNFAFKVAAEFRTRIILFNASIANSSGGFSRVIIPKGLMENVHSVFVNENEVNATFTADTKNYYLYIEYPGNCSIKIVYSELLDLYHQLLDKISSLNDTNNILVEKINTLNETLHSLLTNWSDFQKLFFNINTSYQVQEQNLKNLAYIFALAIAIFIMVTIYLSKLANTKQSRIVES